MIHLLDLQVDSTSNLYKLEQLVTATTYFSRFAGGGDSVSWAVMGEEQHCDSGLDTIMIS